MIHRLTARAEDGIAAHHRAGLCPDALTLLKQCAIIALLKTESFAQLADAEEMAKHEISSQSRQPDRKLNR